jgi:signal transduction histidine kinase
MSVRKAFSAIFSTMTISLLTLVLFLWLAYQHSLEATMRNDAVEHTYRVRLKTKDLLEAMLDIETGARGYYIVQDRKFLRPYFEGKSRIGVIYKSLRELVKDNPLQLSRVDSLDRLMTLKIKLVENNIRFVMEEQNANLVVLQEGRETMDNIRAMTGRFLKMEEKLQIERNQSQLDADQNLKTYSMIFSGLALLFLLLFFRLLYLELSRRFRTQVQLEQNIVELKHTNAELEQFSNVASHDLQEPLRKIRTFSERLSRKNANNLDDDGKFTLTRINDAARRMQDLINDLLMFSQATNFSEKKFESVNLNTIISSVKDELSLSIAEKKAQISIVPAVLPTLNVIPFQMHQLFANLISNALKYSKSGLSPVIEVSHDVVIGADIEHIEGVLPENQYYHFAVNDNGIGFENMYNEKIFVIFQRLHNRNEYTGTGIGLTICRRIVTNHRGFIIADAEEGIGSTFHIYLPIN